MNFINDSLRLNENQAEAANKQIANAQITILAMVIVIGVLYVAVHALGPKIEGQIIIEG